MSFALYANRRPGKSRGRGLRRGRFEVLEPRLVLAAENAWSALLAAPDAAPLVDGQVENLPHFSLPIQTLSPGEDELAPMPQGLREAGPAPAGASYATLPNGMPILDSLPGAPATIFLDFDGDASTNTQAYDEDGNPSNFNATEADNIAECWRQMTVYYAMFDVTVTTIQPNVTTTATAWEAVGNNISGGWSYVNVFPNRSRPMSFNQSSDARSRVSGIAHEIGHNFGHSHQSSYDLLGNKTAEYSSGYDSLHGPLAGVDFAGVVHKWIIGHPSQSPSTLQDDMAIISGDIRQYAPTGYTGDGYRTDDFGGTIAAATPLPASGNVQSITGIIERLTDADAFSFTIGSDGRYFVGAMRDVPSGVDLKLSIYDSGSNLIARQDGDPLAQPLRMNNDQQLTMQLSPGTYYAIVESHGNYGDQGQYTVTVAPLADGWTSQDIGLCGAAGWTSYDAGASQFTVKGGGADIWNTADSFQFAWQRLQGDGSITARITSFDNTDYWAKAGVVIRESLDSGAKSVAMVASSQGGPQMSWRTNTGGSTTGYWAGAQAFTPTWLRLERSGNTFRGYISSNGTAWTQWSTATVSMGQTVYIGLGNTAHNQSRLNTATFTNVALTGTINPGLPSSGVSAPANLAVTGSSASTASLSWNDVAGELNYVVERSSDAVTFAQVGTTAAGVTTFADTGLSGAERYSYRVRAQDASGYSAPSNVVHCTTRPGAVANLTITSWTTTQLVLNWLDASGETSYRVDRSPDGASNWTARGTVAKNTPSFTDSGLTTGTQYYYRVVTVDATGDSATSAVASTWTRLPAVTAWFTNKASNQMAIAWSGIAEATSYRIDRSTNGTSFTTAATLDADTTTYTDNNVSPLGEYYYRVIGVSAATESILPSPLFAAAPAATALPGVWQSQDIGAVSGTGAAGWSGGTFTVVADGGDIWGAADQFRFLYVPVAGDTTIVARVTAVEDTAGWAKSGVMVRSSLAANAAFAFTVITPGNGAVFQYRSSVGGGAGSVDGPDVAAPYWVRLVRSGNTFTSSVSSDGSSWTQIDSRSMTMGPLVYVGLALCSGNSTLLNTSTFTNVTVTGAVNAAPTVVTPASASPNPLSGNTTDLSVLGADDGGEAALTYTWAATTIPSGAAVPAFTVNGTNAAQETTASLNRPGTYAFTVTIADAYNATATSSVNVIVDVTPPTMTISGPSLATTLGAPVAYTITYADPILGPITLGPADITLNSTGTAAATISVTGSGATRTVTLSNFAGDGTLGISIAAGTASDLAGNQARAAGPSSTFIVDTAAPAVLAISRLDPSPTNADSVRFAVTFTEDVTGVDPTDIVFAVTGSAWGAPPVVLSGSGANYIVTVDGVAGDGTLGLTVVDDGTIFDMYGHRFNAGGAPVGQTYTIDNSPPRVLSINRSGLNPTNATSLKFAVTFSESVSGVDVGDFNPVLTGLPGTVASVTGVGVNYTVTVNLTGTGTATARLDLADNNSILDAATNALGGPALGDGDFSGQVYNVDTSLKYFMYWLKPVPGGTGDYSISGSFIGGDQNAGDAYTVSVNSLPAGTASINFQLYASIGGQDASPGNDTLVSGLLDILNAPSADGALLGQPNPVSLVNGLNGVNSSGGIVSGDVDGAGGMDLGGPLTTGTLPGTDGMWVRPYNPSAGVGGTAVNANGWTDILLGTFSYTFGNAGAVLGGQSARLWTAGVSYTGGGSANYADLWRQDGRSQRESDGNKVGAGPAVTIAVKPLVSVGGVSQLEGNQETTDFAFPITLSMPCAQPVQVTVDTIDGTATLADNDFQALHQVVTFAPGETSKTATVRVSGNARLENDETFTLSLSNVAGAGASLAVSTATGTVLNDDGTVPLGDSGGVVRIACDPGDPTHGTAAVFFNGSLVPTYVVATSRFSQFHVLGGAGQDRLTLDFAHGNPLPAQGLTFDEAVGKTGDSLAWQGMTGPLHASPSGITDGSMRPVTMHNVSFCEFAFADAPDNRLTIDGVTLALDRDNAISANAAVEVVNGGALDLGNKSHVVKSLALTDGRILNGTLESALHVLGNGEITAHVAGGRVVKIVPGTTVLSGQNSYTGGTEVLSDVLLVATSGALPGGGAITIGAGATVALGIDMNLTASAAATVAAVAPAVSPPSPRSQAEPGNQRNQVNPQVTPDSAISMLGDGLPTTPRLSAQPLVPVGDGPYRRSPLLAAASSRAVKPAAHAAALVAREAAPLPPAASWLVLTEQTVRPKRSSEKIGAALAAVDEVLARRGR